MIRLKELRRKKGLSQSELAKKINVAQNTVSNWENGNRIIDSEKAIAIAEFFGVTTDYLLGNSIDNNTEPISLPQDIIKIPVLGRIPAGIPMEAIEDVLEYIDIPEDMTRGGKEFFALKLHGDSMYPKYLDGDIVIFEKSETCETGNDCAVMVNGDDATFKRIERKESGIVVKPLNPEYETLFFTNEEVENIPIRIIGVAVELRRRT